MFLFVSICFMVWGCGSEEKKKRVSDQDKHKTVCQKACQTLLRFESVQMMGYESSKTQQAEACAKMLRCDHEDAEIVCLSQANTREQFDHCLVDEYAKIRELGEALSTLRESYLACNITKAAYEETERQLQEKRDIELQRVHTTKSLLEKMVFFEEQDSSPFFNVIMPPPPSESRDPYLAR